MPDFFLKETSEFLNLVAWSLGLLLSVCMLSHFSAKSNSVWHYRLQLPSFPVHGILQARILEWAAMPFSRASCWARDQTWVSCISGSVFIIWATRKPTGDLCLLTGLEDTSSRSRYQHVYFLWSLSPWLALGCLPSVLSYDLSSVCMHLYCLFCVSKFILLIRMRQVVTWDPLLQCCSACT